MAEFTINFQARTYGAEAGVFRGHVLCRDAYGYYVRATAERRAAGWPPVAIALSSSGLTEGNISVQYGGDLDEDVGGLGLGPAWPVICDANGGMARKQTPTGDDCVIGQADPGGNVQIVWPAPRAI